MTRSTRTIGTDPRPVAVPDDVDDPRHEKASGVVQLPTNVRWSGPTKTYDLDDPIDLARVYEQVLREGTDDDVRRFIEVDVLEKLWGTIVVPPAFGSRGRTGSGATVASTWRAERAPAARRPRSR